MFGMGWSEVMLVGIVALIVIGPKDLPSLFFKMGEFAGKARGLAREFNNAMNDAARESGLNDVKTTLNAAANPKKFGVDKIREATGTVFEPSDSPKKGPATQALSEERAASKAKFEAAAADIVHKRKAAIADPDAPSADDTPPVKAPPKSKSRAKPKNTATQKAPSATKRQKAPARSTKTAAGDGKAKKAGKAKTGPAKAGPAKTGNDAGSEP